MLRRKSIWIVTSIILVCVVIIATHSSSYKTKINDIINCYFESLNSKNIEKANKVCVDDFKLKDTEAINYLKKELISAKLISINKISKLDSNNFIANITYERNWRETFTSTGDEVPGYNKKIKNVIILKKENKYFIKEIGY